MSGWNGMVESKWRLPLKNRGSKKLELKWYQWDLVIELSKPAYREILQLIMVQLRCCHILDTKDVTAARSSSPISSSLGCGQAQAIGVGNILKCHIQLTFILSRQNSHSGSETQAVQQLDQFIRGIKKGKSDVSLWCTSELASSLVYLFFTPCERSGTSPSSPQAGVGSVTWNLKELYSCRFTLVKEMPSFRVLLIPEILDLFGSYPRFWIVLAHTEILDLFGSSTSKAGFQGTNTVGTIER